MIVYHVYDGPSSIDRLPQPYHRAWPRTPQVERARDLAA
jgi:hypothetical protein